MNMIKKGITPRDIMTKEAFENAITVVIALGGSPTPCCTCSPWRTPRA
jgi:dihydroxyacid dehydratase/phosphogluconate dehydratase